MKTLLRPRLVGQHHHTAEPPRLLFLALGARPDGGLRCLGGCYLTKVAAGWRVAARRDGQSAVLGVAGDLGAAQALARAWCRQQEAAA